MVRPLTLVLVGILLYTVVVMAIRARGLLPDFVRVQGPITTIHTKHGRVLLDKLAAPRRFWRAWANFGVGLSLVVMVLAFFMVFTSALRTLQQPEVQTFENPQNVLVIPGVNEFLPLSAAPEIVFGLLVGLVVHEGGHGLLCRVERIDIDSMGLALLTFIPVGAFVEPDEQSRTNASRGGQTRMFAAGVTNNFAITVIALLLLFGPVAGSIAVVEGVPVGDALPGSAAADAGLDHGDVITHVNGTAVENATQLERRLDAVSTRSVAVRLRSGETRVVERSLLIRKAVGSVLGNVSAGGSPLRIRAVNGTAVYTENGFARAVSNRTVVRLATTGGNTTLPIGVYARTRANGSLAAAGAPTDSGLILTRVNGHRTPNETALANALDGTSPGETVSVEAYVDGQRHTYEVRLANGAGGDGAIAGLVTQPGYSGLVLAEFGLDAYPAGYFLRALDAPGLSPASLLDGRFVLLLLLLLVLPFYSLVFPSGRYDFAGFTGEVAHFYTVADGPLAFLGGGVFLLANLLFWTAWVNLNLGLFNCIPTFPLDGGHILRTCTETVVSRLPISDGRRATSAVTTSVTLLMLVALFLMVFGPQLLS